MGPLGCDTLSHELTAEDDTSRLHGASALAAANDACALVDGALFCWGQDEASTLERLTSDDELDRIYTARVVAKGIAFTSIALGSDFRCGLSAGQILCWGQNDSGQLGDGTLVARAGPTPVRSSERFTKVAAGSDFACGLTEDARVFCWGSNALFPLSPQENRGELVITPSGAGCYARPFDTGLNGIDDVFVGARAMCALRGDQLACWGYGFPSLFNTDTTSAEEAKPVQGSWKSIAIGSNHLCAINTAGELHCAGKNYWGMLGTGTDTLRQCNGKTDCAPTLLRVPGRSDWTFVAVSEGHTCGIAGAQLFCWGNNEFGQLGLASRSSTPCLEDEPDIACAAEPQPLGKPGTWSNIALGAGYTCGLRDTAVFCWGAFPGESGLRPYHGEPRAVRTED
jgi:alpha-tubulin suppressor-like RCC1 family protein